MPHDDDDDADIEALPVDGGNSEMPPTDEVDGGVPDLPNQNAMVSTKYFYFFIFQLYHEIKLHFDETMVMAIVSALY